MKHLTLLLAAVSCCLLACDSSTETGDGGEVVGAMPPLTFDELINPESCKDCHPKHYEQWSASMHAYAAVDPVFLAMNKRGQEETGGAMGDFCVNCHAPMAVATGALATDFTNIEALPEHLKGVTCYFCHNAVGVGDKHANGNVMIAMDDVMRAAVNNPVEPSTHKVAYSSFHDANVDNSSTLCGTCHDIENDLGVPLERTFKEYKASIFGSTDNPGSFQSCQNCHMQTLPGGRQQIATKTGRPAGQPGSQVAVRDLHEHLWPAVDVALTEFPHADAMRSAVAKCVLPNAMSSYITIERDEGPQGRITVRMEQDAGHNFPSGAAQDRRLWLELIAYDENLTELYRIGQIGDQEVEETADKPPHPCMFREHMLDANGQETHDFWEAASIPPEKSNLMPTTPKGGSPIPGNHTATCGNIYPPLAYASVAPAFFDLRLRMRPVGLDVLNDLVSTGHLAADVPTRMETFTVFSRRATFLPESRSYAVTPQNDDTTLGDCRTYYCLIDPQSQECLAQQ